MKYLTFLFIIFIASPSYAVTWNQFWRPFRNGGYYTNYYPRYYGNCRREVFREEVVSGEGRMEPYVRTFKEVEYYPC